MRKQCQTQAHAPPMLAVQSHEAGLIDAIAKTSAKTQPTTAC